VIYAIFDKEFKGSFLENNPDIYTPGIKDNYFSIKLFWLWFVNGVVQAFFILISA
jgi:hypothetical protein